jgi:hypothetical protein
VVRVMIVRVIAALAVSNAQMVLAHAFLVLV